MRSLAEFSRMSPVALLVTHLVLLAATRQGKKPNFSITLRYVMIFLLTFYKEGVLFSKGKNVPQTQVHTQSSTVSKSFVKKCFLEGFCESWEGAV